jgi:hypothetical protein
MNSKWRLLILLWASVLMASSGSSQCYAQGIASPQNQKVFTGGQLYRAINDWTLEREQGLDFIRGIYASKVNKENVPDRTALGALFIAFMDTNQDKWDKPIEDLLVEALKDAPAQIKAQEAYWANAYAAAGAYFAQPTPENADKFLMALPAERAPMIDPDGEVRLREYVLDFFGGDRKNFGVLDKKLGQADPHAWDICYRLLNISDGGYSEIVLYGLGTLITINPRLFLQKVLAHQPSSLDYLDSMLMMVAEFGEIPEAGGDSAKYEEISNNRIAQRIKALESIDDQDLAKLRDQCISKLRQGVIKRY